MVACSGWRAPAGVLRHLKSVLWLFLLLFFATDVFVTHTFASIFCDGSCLRLCWLHHPRRLPPRWPPDIHPVLAFLCASVCTSGNGAKILFIK